MDNILAPLQDAFEGQIDFHGQRLAELLSTVLLIIFGAISFLVGYIYKDIHLTLWTGLGGTLFTALVVVPPWPFYNQNPEKWFGSVTGKVGGARVVVDGVKVA
ncbi:microsomal signal peptidase subunit SPC12 [Penicillium cataractarum]|uniref:Signal peptidase complex subunit 1 n=1 Tax=Penicillium cataractarum TaxID=2100454 RepID=A0A9W9RS85_9EURO|nr:microsomal signal peptidase subunit SPC12 [Penicillium cataractarum]KAJ5364710.1 microsomal signal peptidase subunit SPC12 [Penicillium cataractarum]